MDVNVLNTILSDKSLLVMMLAPGMLFTGLLMFVLFKVLKIVGQKYLDMQERQVAAFEELVKSVTALEHYLRDAKMREDAIEMTLKKISEDISYIKVRVDDNNVK